MIAHAMKYVGMAERLRALLSDTDVLARRLKDTEQRLQDAEVQTVRAYRSWRNTVRYIAEYGTGEAQELAKRLLEETTWDLT